MFKKKRLLSLITAMMIVLTMLPMNAFAGPTTSSVISGTIELDGVVEPVAGAVPKFDVKIKDGTNLDNRYKIEQTQDGKIMSSWRVWNESTKDWESFYYSWIPSESKTFERGRVYQFNVDLKSNDGFVFPGFTEPAFKNIQVKMNGKKAFGSSMYYSDGRRDDRIFVVRGFFHLVDGLQPEYTATFDTDGGSNIPPVKVRAGMPYLGGYFSSLIENPVKPGYEFVKWNRVGLTDREIMDDDIGPMTTKQEVAKTFVFRYPMLDNYTFKAEWMQSPPTPSNPGQPLTKTETTVKLNPITVNYGGEIIPSATADGVANPDFMYEYEGSGSTSYSKNVTAPTKVGTYTVTATLISATHIGTATADLTINPKPITITGVQAVDRPENGTTQVTLTGGTLQGIKSGDTVGFDLGTGTIADPAAGTNKAVTTNITLTGADAQNYTLTQPSDITVNITSGTTPGTKLQPDATAPASLNAKYGQSLKDITISGGTGATQGTWSWKNPTTKVGNVGTQTHEAIFTPTDTNTYSTKNASINVVVAKANAITIANQTREHRASTTGTQSINVKGLLPADIQNPNVIVGAPTGTSIFNNSPSYSGGNISYSLKSGVTAGQTSTVRITVKSDNYEDMTFNAVIRVISADSKDTPTITIGKTSLVYSGSIPRAYEVDAEARVGNSRIDGNWSWTYRNEPGADAGSYNVEIEFTPRDTARYNTVKRSFRLTVEKAEVTGQPRASQINQAGRTLRDVDLEKGSLSPSRGRLEWVRSSSTEVKANTSYEWIFRPDDSRNYKEKTGWITPYRVSQSSGNNGSGGSGGSGSKSNNSSGNNTTGKTQSTPKTVPNTTGTPIVITPYTNAPIGEAKAVLKIGKTSYTTAEGTKNTDVAPRVIGGKTFLPAKIIAEVLGIQTSFDNASKTTTFTAVIDGEKNTVSVTRGKKVMMVNGKPVPLSTNSRIIGGRTMLPLRDIQKAFNGLGQESTLVWDGANKEVKIF